MPAISNTVAFAYGIHCAIGSILMIASFYKVRDLPQWERDLAAYGVFSRDASTLVAAKGVIAVELGLGMASVLQLWPTITLSLAVLVFATLLGVVGFALARKRHIDCGCFGSRSRGIPLGNQSVARLVLLLALALSALAVVIPGEAPLVTGISAWTRSVTSGIVLGLPLVLLFFLLDALPQLLVPVEELPRQSGDTLRVTDAHKELK